MITWDEAKRQANIAKHGIDFADCEGLFDSFTVTYEDDRDDYGEQRLRSLTLFHGVVLFVVWIPRGEDTHLISIRKRIAARTNRHERMWRINSADQVVSQPIGVVGVQPVAFLCGEQHGFYQREDAILVRYFRKVLS